MAICTNRFHLPKNDLPRGPETGIKDGFKEMEENSRLEYFRCSVAPGNFFAGTIQKVMFYLLQYNWVFRKLFVNGK